MKHSMDVTIMREEIVLTPVCHVQPGEDWCRRECPEGCEEIPCGHDLLPTDYCNAVEFLTNTDESLQDTYVGEGAPLHDGMEIETSWDGDNYTWYEVQS